MLRYSCIVLDSYQSEEYMPFYDVFIEKAHWQEIEAVEGEVAEGKDEESWEFGVVGHDDDPDGSEVED